MDTHDNTRDDPFENLKKFDPALFSGTGQKTPRGRETRTGQTRISGPFLPGHAPWDWLVAADELGGSALRLALVIYRKAVISRSSELTARVGLNDGEMFGMSSWGIREALNRLEDSGLVHVTRSPGRKAVVRIVLAGSTESDSQHRRFIRNPIPWGWLEKAARCTTPGLLVGLAVWRSLYMSRSGDTTKIRIDHIEGSTRKAKELRRGLRALETAGLVKIVEIRAGLAHVRIQDQATSPEEGQ